MIFTLLFRVTLAIVGVGLIVSCKSEVPGEHYAVLESIRLNQVGFLENQKKLAVWVSSEPSQDFWIRNRNTQERVFEGRSEIQASQTFSGKDVQLLDFSGLNAPGSYELILTGLGKSHPFEISNTILSTLGKASLKAFYFQRASTELTPQFAGEWARPLAHADDQVWVHPSAVGPKRTESSILNLPKGWYDAGDYNKYIVNSGISTATLLSLYEEYSDYFDQLHLDIPESTDQIPDILNEIQWNLDWMMGMQDPADGGVYHKLTSATFEGMVQPQNALKQRYVVQKSTAASLDFAAVMAQAYRVFKPFSPENSEWYLKAAEKAYKWAQQNPNAIYDQNQLNEHFNPQIHTGAYGDRFLLDEWIWAASELFIATHNLDYWTMIESEPVEFELPTWNQVKWLGYYSMLRHESNLKSIAPVWFELVKSQLFHAAENYKAISQSAAFRSPMESSPSHFVWGSSAVAANQGIALIQAFKLSSNVAFIEAAHDNLDYLLGRNATGYSYVTGFGEKSPIHPHHRLLAGKEDSNPIPGFLVGGPNPGQQDRVGYQSKFADESYLDVTDSYASNEIAINWNAALAYLANSLQILQKD